MYLSHIYQLAASARSVVAENRMLRMRLKATKQSATLVRGRSPCPPCQSKRRPGLHGWIQAVSRPSACHSERTCSCI